MKNGMARLPVGTCLVATRLNRINQTSRLAAMGKGGRTLNPADAQSKFLSCSRLDSQLTLV